MIGQGEFTPQRSKPTLRENPGFAAFSKNMGEVSHLLRGKASKDTAPTNWRGFIMHDLKSIPTIAFGPFTADKSHPENKKLGELMLAFNYEMDMVKQLDILEDMTKVRPERTNIFPKPLEDDYLRRNQIFQYIYPALKQSALFLLKPTEDNYQKMMDVRTSFGEVVYYEFPELLNNNWVGQSLNGFETVILFNFLKNAKAYGKNVSVALDEGGFTVSNFSSKGLPDSSKLFQVGGMGEGGNTGIGMFTSAKLYAPLLGKEIKAESINLRNGDPTTSDIAKQPIYSVSFSLQGQRPTL